MKEESALKNINKDKIGKEETDSTNIVENKVKEIIENLRPFLNMDGGDVEFVKYDSNEETVYVRLMGACSMCMIQDDTLENGLLEAIQDEVPEVKNIVNIPL